jgi:predicted transcriptional regulator
VSAVCRTITFPEDVSDRLTKQAEAEDRPISRIVTAAVRVYLNEREAQQ